MFLSNQVSILFYLFINYSFSSFIADEKSVRWRHEDYSTQASRDGSHFEFRCFACRVASWPLKPSLRAFLLSPISWRLPLGFVNVNVNFRLIFLVFWLFPYTLQPWLLLCIIRGREVRRSSPNDVSKVSPPLWWVSLWGCSLSPTPLCCSSPEVSSTNWHLSPLQLLIKLRLGFI